MNWESRKAGCRSTTAPRFIIVRIFPIARRRFGMSGISILILTRSQVRSRVLTEGYRIVLEHVGRAIHEITRTLTTLLISCDFVDLLAGDPVATALGTDFMSAASL